MDYHMQILEFLSLLQKRGLSYAISEISFPSQKTWTIIWNFWNFFPFSKNVEYYMQFLKKNSKMWTILCNFCFVFPFSKNMDYHMQFMKFLSLIQKRGLSY